jgi:hypothetical protein
MSKILLGNLVVILVGGGIFSGIALIELAAHDIRHVFRKDQQGWMKFFLGLGLGLALDGANPDGVMLLALSLLAVMIPATVAMGWGGW